MKLPRLPVLGHIARRQLICTGYAIVTRRYDRDRSREGGGCMIRIVVVQVGHESMFVPILEQQIVVVFFLHLYALQT